MLNLFERLAAALSEGDARAFLRSLDPAMKNRALIEAGVAALVSQNEVSSSIEILKNEGDDTRRTVEVDWFLEIRARERTGSLIRRRTAVKCAVERRKKTWVITSFDPSSFLQPPSPN